MLVRLILNQIGRRLTEELNPSARKQRLLLMLDEFPALGRLDFFESALAFMAGYGLKSFLIAQSLNQMRRPSRTMRIFSSALYCLRVTRRVSRTSRSDGVSARPGFDFIVHSLSVTMSQKPSIPQAANSVSQVMTADNSLWALNSARAKPWER